MNENGRKSRHRRAGLDGAEFADSIRSVLAGQWSKLLSAVQGRPGAQGSCNTCDPHRCSLTGASAALRDALLSGAPDSACPLQEGVCAPRSPLERSESGVAAA